MKDIGILEGDLVVVRPQETAEDGDIVVALVGEEATVKRFFQESDHVRLQPENAAMEPIRSRDVRVLGRVVGPDEEPLVSAVALDRPGARRREAEHPEPSLFDDLGGEPTLDEVLSGAWEGLAAHQHVACPVCGGEMTAALRRARAADRRALRQLRHAAELSSARRPRSAARARRPGAFAPLCWLAQTEQSRRCMPSRKVRTSQGRVVGNADPGKPAGKCHRKDTA